MAFSLPALPRKHSLEGTYDYYACCDYLQARDGYDERDYAGKYTGHPNAPYQDFWHFVLDQGQVQNDGEFVMDATWRQGAAPWQMEILDKYLSTFGEPDEEGRLAITFTVSW